MEDTIPGCWSGTPDGPRGTSSHGNLPAARACGRAGHAICEKRSGQPATWVSAESNSTPAAASIPTRSRRPACGRSASGSVTKGSWSRRSLSRPVAATAIPIGSRAGSPPPRRRSAGLRPGRDVVLNHIGEIPPDPTRGRRVAAAGRRAHRHRQLGPACRGDALRRGGPRGTGRPRPADRGACPMAR